MITVERLLKSCSLFFLLSFQVWAANNTSSNSLLGIIEDRDSWVFTEHESRVEYHDEKSVFLSKNDNSSDSYTSVLLPLRVNAMEGRWVTFSLMALELDEEVKFDFYYLVTLKSGRKVDLFSRIYTKEDVAKAVRLTDYIDERVIKLEVVIRTWGKGGAKLKPIALIQNKHNVGNVELPKLVSAWLTEAWDITKRNWMFQNEDNAVWLERLLFTNLDKDSTLKEARENWKQLIRKFDNHSFYYQKKQAASISHEPKKDNSSIKFPDVVVDDSIGYIDMPSYQFLVDNASEVYGRGLQSNIFKAIPEVECGWIVDLRNNRGGDGQGPVFGLTPLLTHGTVLKFVYPDRKVSELKVSSKGLSVQSPSEDKGTLIIPTDDYFKRRLRKPLSSTMAVLTSARSASAAEMIQITLMGESNVKSFGQKTAGYTTSNETFEMSDGTMLVLATTWLGDRNGNIYPDGITPDVPTALDLAKTKAKQWLLQECQK